MSKHFLSKEEQEKLSKIISEIEKFTDAEVRVHIEVYCKIDPLKRAAQVFKKLKMHKTDNRNAVLFYIASKDSKLAIWGDTNIHAKLGQRFWEKEISLMQEHFRNGHFYQGIKAALIEISSKLHEHYPYLNDKNELSNEISFGDGLS